MSSQKVRLLVLSNDYIQSVYQTLLSLFSWCLESLTKLPDTQWPIGAYEGGGYLEKGIYRPWPKCMMNQLYNFCPVCQAAIKEYLDYICK